MDSFVLGVQLLLAAVFVTAGVAKLLDRPGTRQALSDFGVPTGLVPSVAWLLPLAELVTALALLSPTTARGGAIAALVLLVAFIAGIARAMARGEAPDCHCFGQLHSAPAGRGTLVRNAVLAALAAFVAVRGPGPAIDTWVEARTPAELTAVGLGIVAVVLAGLCLRFWLDNRELRGALAREREVTAAFPPGLPLGTRAPAFDLPDVHGERRSLGSLLEGGRPVVLVFVSPGCGSCWTLFPDLGRWQTALADQLTIALISTGSVEDNLEMETNGLMSVLRQDDWEVAEAYRIDATPSAVVVTPEGTIASAVTPGAPAIEPLIRLTLRGGPKTPTTGPADVSNGARSEQQRIAG